MFWVHWDVPDLISYYMEGTLESADCNMLLELVIASGERHLISDFLVLELVVRNGERHLISESDSGIRASTIRYEDHLISGFRY